VGARHEEAAFDLFRIQGAQQGAGSFPDPAASPAAEGGKGGHVLEQPLAGIQFAGGFLGLDLAGLEKEQRLRDDAIADEGSAVSPGRVEILDFPAAEPGRRNGARQGLAVVPVGARQGDQVLGGRVRDDLAAADRLLHGIGQFADEGQPTADPTGGPVEPAGEFLQGEPEPASELLEEPRLLQSGLRAALSKRSSEKEGVGLGEVPAGGPDPIVLEARQRADALVAVDDDGSAGSGGGSDDDDGDELSHLGNRGHESSLLPGGEDPESFISQIELVQIQFHRRLIFPHARKGAEVGTAGSGRR
jgi:hypothetical protein